jgi:hypothetical protein
MIYCGLRIARNPIRIGANKAAAYQIILAISAIRKPQYAIRNQDCGLTSPLIHAKYRFT